MVPPSWAPRVQSPLRLRRGTARLFDTTAKLQLLIGIFGSLATAQVLGLSKSLILAYASGALPMNFEAARRIDDVEYVLFRALCTMHEDEIGPWLVAPEPLLGNATPLNTLAMRGVAPVIAALDALFVGTLT